MRVSLFVTCFNDTLTPRPDASTRAPSRAHALGDRLTDAGRGSRHGDDSTFQDPTHTVPAASASKA
jgi:hypothetical protein